MGFLDKAKQAANEMAAKADQAMANAGISGPAGAPGGMGANRAADAALRDFGLITWREAHGHPVDASEKERVLHTLQGLEAGGQLAPLRCTSAQGAGGLYGSPPPGAPLPGMPGLPARGRSARNRGIRRSAVHQGLTETLPAEHRRDRFIITCNGLYLTIPHL